LRVSVPTDGGTGLDLLRAAASPLAGRPEDFDPLLAMIGDARFVLLGEASHGTDEFYRTRADITRRLIEECGFTAVAVEADWPDAYRVNCYVRGVGDERSAEEALAGFQRFPAWMWRNTAVLEFVTWLHARNRGLPPEQRAGFYGIDLYGLHASIAAVIGYLNEVDPEAARRARERYDCFEFFGQDPQLYGHATAAGLAEPCEDAVVLQLQELQRRSIWHEHRGRIAEDDAFEAEQNARLVKNAEEYYRAMFRGRISSWNLRDSHMVETINALTAHLDRNGGRSRVVVWAHNSHLGDASATQMGESGEWNVGQLLREQYGRDAVLIGFTTHTGTVTAADDWGGPALRKQVVPSLPGSVERLLHETGVPRFFLNVRDDAVVTDLLRQQRLERAIGVIYRPQTERMSHYFFAAVSEQFDALVHLDITSAVEPLEPYAPLPEDELPETYPFEEG
jgi:erythromycin esterase-like protein